MTKEEEISEDEGLWLPKGQPVIAKNNGTQKELENYKKNLSHMFLNGQLTSKFFTEKNGKKQFEPAKLSTSIREIFPICSLKDNNEIYIYNEKKGYYEDNGEKTLREIVKKILRDEYRESRAKAVIDDITASTYIEREDFIVAKHLIPVKNGILDVRYNPPKFLPPNPKHYITNVIPVKYDSKAKCSNFIRFLEQILPDITINIHFKK